MQIKADSPEEYIDQLPEDRKEAISQLRKVILDNLPEGFVETMSYGMIGYVVPHSIYPQGYHCDPKLPLPFMNIASQKNYIAVYHMGMYGDKKLFDWFADEYTKRTKSKPDMGKSCIRFKKFDKIPYELIGELTSKISLEEWKSIYQKYLERPVEKKK
jgi:uncharacterized protein YdhG (YjbR/CyaY superfamily)